LLLEDEPQAWTTEIGSDNSMARDGRAVEQHVLNSDVVMKPFEMTQTRQRTSDMTMERRRTVARKIDVMRFS
jgi:hypothetical protein